MIIAQLPKIEAAKNLSGLFSRPNPFDAGNLESY